jgi:hypothetical protein
MELIAHEKENETEHDTVLENYYNMLQEIRVSGEN